MLADPPTLERPTVRDADASMRRFGRFSLFAAVYTYLLVIFGGLVRITGSGLGCGDDWPKCNGRWIPEFNLQTLIEYVHRLLGVSIGLVIIGLALYAFMLRKHSRLRAGGADMPVYFALGLVAVQGLLGAITVWLELPTSVIVVHFMTALVIMALLIQAAVRAGAFDPVVGNPDPRSTRGYQRAAVGAAALGFLVIALGATTANTLGAPQACQGFPLCNGALVPANVPQVHIHWTHRLLAFALLLHVLFTVLRNSREYGSAQRAGLVALVLIATQIVVAAGLVLLHLPSQLKALHLAVGGALWGALVLWVLLARRLHPPTSLST